MKLFALISPPIGPGAIAESSKAIAFSPPKGEGCQIIKNRKNENVLSKFQNSLC